LVNGSMVGFSDCTAEKCAPPKPRIAGCITQKSP
jgi:hypothetical protein